MSAQTLSALPTTAAFLRSQDGFVVASFPRSGSTLTRDIVVQLVRLDLRKSNRSVVAGHPALVDTTILPNLNSAPFSRPMELARYPFIVRTHDPEPIAHFRTVFWFREPLDSLFSYFHLEGRKHRGLDFAGFCRLVMPRWQALARAAISRAKANRAAIHVVRYEHYLADPVGTFQGITQFLDLPGRERTARAVEVVNARFRKGVAFQATPAQPQRGAAGVGIREADPALKDEVTAALSEDLAALDALAGSPTG